MKELEWRRNPFNSAFWHTMCLKSGVGNLATDLIRCAPQRVCSTRVVAIVHPPTTRQQVAPANPLGARPFCGWAPVSR